MFMPLDYLSSLVRLNIEFLLVDVVMPPYGQPKQSQRSVPTLRCLHLKGDVSFASIFNKSTLQLGLGNCLVFVEELRINACSNIACWPVEELRCLPRLRCLRIWFCSKLEGKGCSLSKRKSFRCPSWKYYTYPPVTACSRSPSCPHPSRKSIFTKTEVWWRCLQTSGI